MLPKTVFLIEIIINNKFKFVYLLILSQHIVLLKISTSKQVFKNVFKPLYTPFKFKWSLILLIDNLTLAIFI